MQPCAALPDVQYSGVLPCPTYNAAVCWVGYGMYGFYGWSQLFNAMFALRS